MNLYNIELREKSDGHWLCVKTTGGKKACIHLGTILQHGPIVNATFLTWAKEEAARQEEEPQHTVPDDLIEKLNQLMIDYKLMGEPQLRMLIQRTVRAIEHFQQLQSDFLKLEALGQSGSDMEGHELALQMNMILHPELYGGE